MHFIETRAYEEQENFKYNVNTNLGTSYIYNISNMGEFYLYDNTK